MTNENATTAGAGGTEANAASGESRDPGPETLPRPTFWPAILALSVCFALWGVLTSVWLIVVGAAGTLLAAARWFGELQHERDE